jgi:hypothetical protein
MNITVKDLKVGDMIVLNDLIATVVENEPSSKWWDLLVKWNDDRVASRRMTLFGSHTVKLAPLPDRDHAQPTWRHRIIAEDHKVTKALLGDTPTTEDRMVRVTGAEFVSDPATEALIDARSTWKASLDREATKSERERYLERELTAEVDAHNQTRKDLRSMGEELSAEVNAHNQTRNILARKAGYTGPNYWPPADKRNRQ